MTQDAKTPEREDIDLLLPWYVNGTLDEKETAMVEAALAEDADLRLSLALIRDDQAASIELMQEEPVPESIAPRFMAQLDAEIDRVSNRQETAQETESGLLARLGSWFAGTLLGGSPQRMGLAAVAAAVVIALQAGLLTSLVGVGPSDQTRFKTASGDAAVQTAGGPAFLVQFADEIDMTELSGFLEKENARLVDGPLTGGFFRIRFAEGETRGKDDLAGVLRGRAAFFKLVLPSG